MSIKQNGGVFGRNPTFNDVTIDGTLTFDGDIDINSDLKIDGDLDVIGGMTVDTNVLVVDKTNNRVGIGTASPSNLLTTDSTTGDGLQFKKGGVGQLRIDCTSGTGGIYHAPGGMSHTFKTAGIEALVLDGSQNAKVSNGNLVIGTSGKGIDFSATAGTGTSELLDDYEEGTWTPNYTAATGGNLGGTQSRQGYYTKVGNKVTVQLYLFINTIDVTGKSGSVTVTGLPFTGSLGGNATGVIVTTESTGSYGAFTNSPRTAKLSGTGDSLTLLKEISSNVEQPLDVTDFATGAGNRNIIRCSFTYIV